MSIPTFSNNQLEAISRATADAATHAELTRIFVSCGIREVIESGPKWQRILYALRARQEQDRCGNNVGAFLQALFDPVRFVASDPALHQQRRETVNGALHLAGFRIDEKGRLVSGEKASTVSEAQARAKGLREELVSRKVHPEVLRFCRAELLQDNYFHAVLEATKSLADAIRTRTGLIQDGADLVDRAFGGERPMLALSTLESDTQRAEQRGFVNLLKGTFGTFRNPTAHAPRISWQVTFEDALDLLTLASYLHRRIANAHRTTWGE